MFSKILVCTDGSRKATDAAQVAAAIASKFGSEVILLSVFDPSVFPAAGLNNARKGRTPPMRGCPYMSSSFVDTGL